jgi:hypothetical protein
VTLKAAQRTGKRVSSPIHLDEDAATKPSDLVHLRKQRRRIVFGRYAGAGAVKVAGTFAVRIAYEEHETQ